MPVNTSARTAALRSNHSRVSARASACALAFTCACANDGAASDSVGSSDDTSGDLGSTTTPAPTTSDDAADTTGSQDAGSSSGASSDGSTGDESSTLLDTLHARLDGDRTGSCIAAAVIDGADVERAIVCAARPPLPDATAFEIGSVSKTMTAFLAARAVEQGTMALEAPIATYLPPDTAVPAYGDQAITVAHLLTHTSGLPTVPASWIPDMDPSDPYAHVDDARLLEALADTELTQAPGSTWAYSNFGYMTLSFAVARAFEGGLESALHDELFAPLGMSAFLQPPPGTELATPHLSNGTPTPTWTFSPDLAGVGGVHASLDDMTRYAQAVLGDAPAELTSTFELATAELRHEPPAMAMGWVLLDIGGRQVLAHDGGTGGSSAIVLVDREGARAVVLLCDTSWGTIGGLAELSFHLFDPSLVALDPVRVEEPPPPALVSALVGTYSIPALGLSIELRLEGNDDALVAVVDGGDALPLGFDSYGDFFTRGDVDAVLRPMLDDDGQQTFALLTSDGQLPAVRS